MFEMKKIFFGFILALNVVLLNRSVTAHASEVEATPTPSPVIDYTSGVNQSLAENNVSGLTKDYNSYKYVFYKKYVNSRYYFVDVYYSNTAPTYKLVQGSSYQYVDLGGVSMDRYSGTSSNIKFDSAFETMSVYIYGGSLTDEITSANNTLDMSQFIYSTFDLGYEGEVFFSGQGVVELPTETPPQMEVTTETLVPLTTEILGLAPLLIPLLVAWLALRKGWQMLSQLLHRA